MIRGVRTQASWRVRTKSYTCLVERPPSIRATISGRSKSGSPPSTDLPPRHLGRLAAGAAGAKATLGQFRRVEYTQMHERMYGRRGRLRVMPGGQRNNRSTGRPRGSATGHTRARLLAAIQALYASTGAWPGRRQLAEQLGISEAAVTAHRRQLIDDGAVPAEAANPDRAIRVERLHAMLPLLGRSAGGPPALAVEEVEPLDITELLTDGDEGCYGVVVDGDSMEGAGILPGDIAVIRPQATADDGTVVLAQVIDELSGDARTTIKELWHDRDGRVVLRAANPKVAPLIYEEVRIVGVVVSVVRRIER